MKKASIAAMIILAGIVTMLIYIALLYILHPGHRDDSLDC